MVKGFFIIFIAFIAWVVLGVISYKVATRIEESIQKKEKELYDRYSEDEKKTAQMYIIAFFVGIPILFIIGIIQELL